MSNRLFQSVVHQMRDAVDRTIGVIDETYTVVACSDLGKIGENLEVNLMHGADNEAFVSGRYTYKPFGTPQHPEYLIFVEGTDVEAMRYCSILAVALSSIKFYYDENYDRGNFIKNIILEISFPEIFI